MTLDEPLLHRVDKAASKLQTSRSAFARNTSKRWRKSLSIGEATNEIR